MRENSTNRSKVRKKRTLSQREKWNEKETLMLCQAILIHGKKYKKVSNYVKTKDRD